MQCSLRSVVVLASAFLAGAAAHAEILPTGGPVRLSAPATSAYGDEDPVVAYNAAGRPTVIWENPRFGIQAQRLTIHGQPIGEPVTLVANQGVPDSPGESLVTYRRDPSFLFLDDGSIFLAYTEERALVRIDYFWQETKLLGRDVYGRRFRANGEPLGEPVQLHRRVHGYQTRPELARVGDGIVVALRTSDWRRSLSARDGLIARLLDGKGNPLGDDILVDDTAIDTHASTQRITATPGGGFVISWEGEYTRDEDDYGSWARRFDAAGRPLGPSVLLVSELAGAQRRPLLLPAGDGYFMTWEGDTDDAREITVWGRFLDADLVPVTAPKHLLALGDKETSEYAPALLPSTGGGYILTWRTYDLNRARHAVGLVELDANGDRLTDETFINEARAISSLENRLAGDGTGNYVSVWEETVPGHGRTVIARRLSEAD